jgi:hypothetical protein
MGFAGLCISWYFAMQSTGTGRKFFTVTVDFFTVWEIRHQRINNSLQTVLVRGKIVRAGQR